MIDRLADRIMSISDTKQSPIFISLVVECCYLSKLRLHRCVFGNKILNNSRQYPTLDTIKTVIFDGVIYANEQAYNEENIQPVDNEK